MGSLHDGHASLVRTAAAQNDVVVTTVFVNPLQFAPTDDLAAYPRDLPADRALAEAAGAHLLFAPSVEEMYPFGPDQVFTKVSVDVITETLEGAYRPGHFTGVATVVAKLFAIAGTCRAYFGEKDFQQLAVVRRMAADLSMPVEVVGCPTVREDNGLAMSSRNRYLTEQEREGAAVLYRVLNAGRLAIEHGESDPAAVRTLMQGWLSDSAVVASVDYLEVVDPATFRVPESITTEVRLLVAARVGRARLIDNVAARS